MTTDAELLARLKTHLPEITDNAQDDLLTALLHDADAMIKALTWRESVPEALASARTRLAVILYGRVGIEGESAHAEGEVSRAINDLPESIRREILAYRVAKT